MNSKALLIAGGVGVLLPAALLIGAASAPREATRWEYGTYIGSPDSLEWQGESTYVRTTTVAEFFARMDFPSDAEVAAGTGRISPVLLNLLGERGWELVDVAVVPDHEVYWFKRPRQ